jgi:hypothetical protein
MAPIRIFVPGKPVANRGCVNPKRPAIERWRDGFDVVGSCWIWRGARDAKGYARFRDDSGKKVAVHRFAYETKHGAIPAGLTVDHLCRNPSCCNPDHLEAVTNAENIRRGTQGQWQRSKTHCPQGHAYTPENTYVCNKGKRQCQTCKRERGRVYDAIRRAG